MDVSQNTILSTDITFVLRHDKQFSLLKTLVQHVPLTLDTLSQLMNIPLKKLTAVLEQKNFLSKSEAEKLIQYFCIFFGS